MDSKLRVGRAAQLCPAAAAYQNANQANVGNQIKHFNFTPPGSFLRLRTYEKVNGFRESTNYMGLIDVSGWLAGIH